MCIKKVPSANHMAGNFDLSYKEISLVPNQVSEENTAHINKQCRWIIVYIKHNNVG